MQDRLGSLDARAFATGANLPFLVVRPGQQPVPLRLLDVVETTGTPNEQFALILSGPTSAGLGQGLRQISHDTLGSFPLFLVPAGVDGPTTLFQATFNRLVQSR